MRSLIRKYPKSAAFALFAVGMLAFGYFWSWFVYDHNASVIEWGSVLAALLVVAFLVDWRSKRQ
jgi:hypothetical protein